MSISHLRRFDDVENFTVTAAGMYSSTVTQFEEPPRKKTPSEEVAAEPIPLPPEPAEQPLIWRNIIALATLHVLAVYGLVSYWDQASFGTWLWGEFHLTGRPAARSAVVIMMCCYEFEVNRMFSKSRS